MARSSCARALRGLFSCDRFFHALLADGGVTAICRREKIAAARTARRVLGNRLARQQARVLDRGEEPNLRLEGSIAPRFDSNPRPVGTLHLGSEQGLGLHDDRGAAGVTRLRRVGSQVTCCWPSAYFPHALNIAHWTIVKKYAVVTRRFFCKGLPSAPAPAST